VHTRIGRNQILLTPNIHKIREQEFNSITTKRFLHFFVDSVWQTRGNPAWPHDLAMATSTYSSILTAFRAMTPVNVMNLTFKKTEEMLEIDAQMTAFVNGKMSGFIEGITRYQQTDPNTLDKYTKCCRTHAAAKSEYYNLSHRVNQLSMIKGVTVGQDVISMDDNLFNPVKLRKLKVDTNCFSLASIEVAKWDTTVVTFTKREPTCVECTVTTQSPRMLFAVVVGYGETTTYYADELDNINSKIAAANARVSYYSDQMSHFLDGQKDVLEKYKSYVEKSARLIGALLQTHLSLDAFTELDNILYKEFTISKIREKEAELDVYITKKK